MLTMGAETLTLAADDVSSAIATDASTLEITLTTAGRTNYMPRAGGTTSTGGTADAINIALGFLKDAAGNSPAADTQVTNGSVTLESVRPTIDTISVSPTKSLYAIGDEIEITIVMSEDIRSDRPFQLLCQMGVQLLLPLKPIRQTVLSAHILWRLAKMLIARYWK